MNRNALKHNATNRPKSPALAPVAPANPRLRALLEQGQHAPEDARLALLSELQTATLLVPIREPAPAPRAGRQANVQIAVLENRDGQMLAGFTDMDAYRQFPPVQNLGYAAIAATDLCRFARQGNFRAVLLNAGGPVSYALAPVEYQMVAEKLLPGNDEELLLNRETIAVVGMPEQRPDEETLNAMRAVAQQSGAQEVYWFWLAFAGGIPHLGLAVAPHDAGLIRAIGDQILPLWKAARPENSLLDILPLTDNELSQTIREKGETLL